MINNQGEKETKEGQGTRESNARRGRFDLLPYEALEALAIWYELGAEKYGDRNWEDGLEVADCINRMTRHALKVCNGWTDEDHLSAVMWNAAAAITMMKRRPDLNNHRWKTPEEESDMSKQYWHCDDCGGNFDFGEKCDCTEGELNREIMYSCGEMLWDHRNSKPIGKVVSTTIGPDGITVKVIKFEEEV